VVDFVGWPKIGRLKRDCVITEKIDGTNGSIYIPDDTKPIILEDGREVPFLVGSKNRWIFPESDNFGFAKWAYEDQDELLKLGPGRHFGEWWGQGIQRKYDLEEKRFSLFNTSRWMNSPDLPSCCSVVPIMYEGLFDSWFVDCCLDALKEKGSKASPGFMNPEGVVIFLKATNHMYKVTIDNDGLPKSLVK
jgi:hypothetical protein